MNYVNITNTELSFSINYYHFCCIYTHEKELESHQIQLPKSYLVFFSRYTVGSR